MRIVRGNGGRMTVYTHTDKAKVEVVAKDKKGRKITLVLTPQRARRLAEHISDASDRAEGDIVVLNLETEHGAA